MEHDMTTKTLTAPKAKAPRKPKAAPAAAPVAEVPAAPAPQTFAQTPAQPQPKAQRRSKGITIAAKAEAKACKAGTKQAILVDLLFRSGGASMAELREALHPWQDSTIKSGLSWDMGAIKGYGIRTTHENGYQRWLATDYAGMGTFKGESHPDDNSETERARSWLKTSPTVTTRGRCSRSITLSSRRA